MADVKRSSDERSISDLSARGVYDSNGVVAVEITLTDKAGRRAAAIAPRGSSVGNYEPIQLEASAQLPRLEAAEPAVQAAMTVLRPALIGVDAADLCAVDGVISACDSSPQKVSLGGNTAIACSMAAAHLGAVQSGVALHRHLAAATDAFRSTSAARLRTRPMVNLIDGGLGPASRVAHIEFLLVPKGSLAVADYAALAIECRSELVARVHRLGYEGACSQQGAVSVPLESVETGLELLVGTLDAVGAMDAFDTGLDMAASDVLTVDGAYAFRWADAPIDAQDLLATYVDWADRFSLRYLEDGFASTDVENFSELVVKLPAEIMVSGDDLFASNTERIRAGVDGGWANTVVVKPNQAGTVTDTLRAADVARRAGWSVVVSQRSGENDGSLIADLAVAMDADYLKFGGTSRMDRIAKLNQLIRIADDTDAG